MGGRPQDIIGDRVVQPREAPEDAGPGPVGRREPTGAAGPPIADHLTNSELVIGGSGRYLFATSGGAAVAVISTAANRLARTIRVPDRLGGFVSLQAPPGGRQVLAVVSAGWLVPISAADRRAGPRIPADGQPARIVFGR